MKLVVVLLPLGGVTCLLARHSIVNEIRGTTSALAFAARRPTASRRRALARRPGGHLWRCLCTSPSPSSQDGGWVSRSPRHGTPTGEQQGKRIWRVRTADDGRARP